MARRKIDYGIDLGTTNSAIARLDNGEVRILKSKDAQMDTTPSCVAFNKKQACFVGLRAFSALEDDLKGALPHFQKTGAVKVRSAFAEFKRTMGTQDVYESAHMSRSYSSEELSAEVLKKLRTNVDDESITAAVITVPAMFRQPQIDATARAAQLAGFEYSDLLQEPIAASIAYGLQGKSADGHWLVFDFGGGTFDAALMRIEEGMIKVVDTSGDNHLGGKNLDYAIVDHILIPHLEAEYSLKRQLRDRVLRSQMRESLKPAAEHIKKKFSTETEAKFSEDDPVGRDDDGKEMELDLRIARTQFDAAVGPHIQRAIDLSLSMLGKNRMVGGDLATVILVGGPTFLPTLRDMVREQITPNVNVKLDPMTAVAVGAALHASTKDIPAGLVVRDSTRVQLVLKYPETTVELEEKLGIRVDRSRGPKNAPARLYAEVARHEGLWTSGRVELEGDAQILEIHMLAGKASGFTVRLFDERGDAWPCEPESFTVIQGFKPPEATLPFGLCVHAYDSSRRKECIVPIKGLEKNVTLPATVRRFAARTQTDLHPGKGGELHIPIYETEQPYSRAFSSELADVFVIPASDLPQFLPADSPVELKIEVDASRRITITAYLPSADEEVTATRGTYQEVLDRSDLSIDLRKANTNLAMLEQGAGAKGELTDIKTALGQIGEELEQGGDSGDTRVHVADRLAAAWKRMDELGSESEWPNAEERLNEALDVVMELQERLGSAETAKAVKDVQPTVAEIVRRKDIGSAQKMTEDLAHLRFSILRQHTVFWISLLQHMDESFSSIGWRNPALARQILNEAKQHVAGSPNRARVEEYVRKLWELQPDAQESMMADVNRKLLRV